MTKEYKLRANYSKEEEDLILHYPLGVMTKSDGHYLASIFTQEFLDELTVRGYDITQIRFEIPIKIGSRPEKFKTLENEYEYEYLHSQK